MPYWQPFQHTCRAMRTLQSGVSDKQCGDLTAELLVSNVSSPSGLLISATVSSGLPGERWTLAISTESGHRWSTYPVDGNSTLTTHLPASRAESRTYTLQACRVGRSPHFLHLHRNPHIRPPPHPPDRPLPAHHHHRRLRQNHLPRRRHRSPRRLHLRRQPDRSPCRSPST